MQDILLTILNLLTIIGAGILRNVAGWLENALEDGKIDTYEWGQLGATVFRVGLIGVGLAYGLDLEPFAAAGAAIVADFIISALKKKK